MDITTKTTTSNNTDNIDEQSEIRPEPTKQSANRPKRFSLSLPNFIEWGIVLGLSIITLIPRLLLATQLDMVTDERVYIDGGKIYFPLLTHLNITSGGWTYNYEHPPFVKLLIGFVLSLNTHVGHLFGELFAARIPSIIFGTLLVLAVYWLGRAPFGRVMALLAALSLAVSPWLAYFSALAYLDMTMTSLITIAYLLLWPAIRQPRLYLFSAALLGLAAASKYTAVLALPGMVLFLAYYFLALRPRLPVAERPPVPWKWWGAAAVLAPVVFFLADPAIWRQPIDLLFKSFGFEWNHSVEGHLTFLAGQYGGHVPHWAILYIIVAKISAFVTIPAAFFVIYALFQLGRLHVGRSAFKAQIPVVEASSMAFLLIWLLSILGMFSLLNIVVGTHYHLPLAPPVALSGAFGWIILFRYRRGALFSASTTAPASTSTTLAADDSSPSSIPSVVGPLRRRTRVHVRTAIVLAVIALFLIVPHLIGLITTSDAEGYTSEFFPSENAILQVAYPGYRDAGLWLVAHTATPGKVGLIALPGTLTPGASSSSWFTYNADLAGRLQFSEAHPTDRSFAYDYLIWPMHLIQRGYPIPTDWHSGSHIVHIIMGGNTIYCYILARNPATVSP